MRLTFWRRPRPYFAMTDLRREFEAPGSDASDRGMEEAFPGGGWREMTMHFDAVEIPRLRRQMLERGIRPGCCATFSQEG